MTAPLATLTIDPRYLPLTRREAARLADELETVLTMVACELRKGEHLDSLCIAIMPPGTTPEVDTGATP